MIPIFRRRADQVFFEDNGYILLPLLEGRHTEKIKSFYKSLGVSDSNTYNREKKIDNLNYSLRKNIWDTVGDIVLPEMDKHLKDYKSVFVEFLPKDPNPKSIIPAHQDWSFVDNNTDDFASISCWIALTDVSANNGALGFIKGSHKIMEIDSPPSPSPQAPLPLINHVSAVFSYLNFVEMQEGDMLMFNNRTFHGSLPNFTNEPRWIVRMNITHRDAQVYHYFLKPGGLKDKMLKYKVNDDFRIHYSNERLVDIYESGKTIEGYELVGEYPYRFPKYTREQLVSLMEKLGNEYNANLPEGLFEFEESEKEHKDTTPNFIERLKSFIGLGK